MNQTLDAPHMEPAGQPTGSAPAAGQGLEVTSAPPRVSSPPQLIPQPLGCWAVGPPKLGDNRHQCRPSNCPGGQVLEAGSCPGRTGRVRGQGPDPEPGVSLSSQLWLLLCAASSLCLTTMTATAGCDETHSVPLAQGPPPENPRPEGRLCYNPVWHRAGQGPAGQWRKQDLNPGCVALGPRSLHCAWLLHPD